MDDGRGPPKRIRGNHQSPNTLASYSNGVAMRDNATLLSQIHLLDQVGQLGNSWSRFGQSIMVNNGNNHLVPVNNLVQHFWPTTHIQASNTTYTTANRNGLRFPHLPVNQQHHDNHRPTLLMHGVQPNPPRGGAIPLQPGLHVLQSRGVIPERTLRHQSVHPFESAQIDDVVALNEEVQNRLDGVALNDQMQNLLNIIDLDYDEVEILLDQHQEMRLDTNNMSYEEFIALGDRIGSISTGLPEERIMNQLETRVYTTYPNGTNLEELPYNDQEIVVCTICQTEFENQEKIGILQCKHEYHVECVKNWLVIKNECPICKSEALTSTKNDA